MKSQEKSWRTRKVKDNQRKTGSRVWMHRKNLTIGAKDLLKKWDDEALRKDVCVVCGDGTPRRILITHHLDPDSESEGKITLCASCHNVFNKAKETTSLEEIERDLNLRHQTYQYSVRRILN